MSKTVQERLRDALESGELADCATWQDIAKKLQTTDRVLRKVRARMGNVPPLADIRKADITATAVTVQNSQYEIDVDVSEFAEVPVPVLPSKHLLRGVSTLVDAEGNIKQQWIKTARDADPIRDIVAAFAEIKNELPRNENVQPAPRSTIERKLAAYLIGDAHVGMYAWGPEAGENYDLEIAERNLTTLHEQLVDLAPPAERGLIVNIGDYFHSDNRGNTTTAGTPVDVDGRWAKVLAAGIRIMRRNIDCALRKHQHVTVINEIGNHDTHTSVFLSLALAQFYENEPRVTIDVSPEHFHYFRYGKVLIMTHHGHRVKPQDLGAVLACDRAADWGETLFRYVITGHIHHEREREFPGWHWMSLRSPAPSDAWHRAQGYRSGHSLYLDVFDYERGREYRHQLGIPKNLAARAA